MLPSTLMIPLKPPTPRWDLFCSVIDNYGDIGICWRMARQLVAEHQQQVRLWVDDLVSFQRICPQIDPGRRRQQCHGVEVCHWSAPFPTIAPAEVGDVVVEALACTLPPEFLAAMAARIRQPVWINLEYLSAEAWVDECHGMASPHPQLPLIKYFFFPGFSPATGGLLRERDLLQQRRVFQADLVAQTDFWHSLGVPGPDKNELRLTLFGYDTPAVADLVQVWSAGPQPIRCLVPEGRLAQQLLICLGVDAAQAGDRFVWGNLTVHLLPFLEQDRYDRLLWGCDLNFVRGEDSFVRAQWAGQPLVWQAYRQGEGAHLLKLEAFLQCYCRGLPAAVATDVSAFWLAWNQGVGVAEQWPAFLARREVLDKYGEQWATELAEAGDTVTNLVLFCEKYL